LGLNGDNCVEEVIEEDEEDEAKNDNFNDVLENEYADD
jgi:hypothetical protein